MKVTNQRKLNRILKGRGSKLNKRVINERKEPEGTEKKNWEKRN